MNDAAPEVRLDVWLDVSCLFKTRSEALKACSGGKVEVNGQRAKPHRPVRMGDRIQISRPFGQKQTVTVRVIFDRHVPKSQARQFYADTTPPLSSEQIELRRLERAFRAQQQQSRPPDKRERRTLRRLKGL